MHYADARAAFFQPSPPEAVPEPTRSASSARRLRDAIEPIAMHSVWSQHTNEALAAEGLNFLTGYVWGRAAAMGEPSHGAAAAAFAVFEPGLIAAVLAEGRAACGRDELLRVRSGATIESLHSVLSGVDVTETATALRGAVSGTSGVGRPLFAGLREEPWPDDPVGMLWRSCELAREHRGDSHVAVCVARGLDAVTMNILTELWVGMPLGAYTATRGWPPESIDATAAELRNVGWVAGDALSAAGQAVRDEIEAATDELESGIIDALGPAVDDHIANLAEWSDQCVAAGAFPPDAFKRAAG